MNADCEISTTTPSQTQSNAIKSIKNELRLEGGKEMKSRCRLINSVGLERGTSTEKSGQRPRQVAEGEPREQKTQFRNSIQF